MLKELFYKIKFNMLLKRYNNKLKKFETNQKPYLSYYSTLGKRVFIVPANIYTIEQCLDKKDGYWKPIYYSAKNQLKQLLTDSTENCKIALIRQGFTYKICPSDSTTNFYFSISIRTFKIPYNIKELITHE